MAKVEKPPQTVSAMKSSSIDEVVVETIFYVSRVRRRDVREGAAKSSQSLQPNTPHDW